MWIRKDRGVYGDSAYLYIHQESILNRTIEVILSKPFEGRYVELLLPSKGRQLSVCEVEVYGGRWQLSRSIKIERCVIIAVCVTYILYKLLFHL